MSYLSPLLKLENMPTHLEGADDDECKRYEKRCVVAEWRVPIHGKLFRIEFEHGTTTGKRVIWVNGSEILRRDWMFKLVGEDVFSIEDTRCILRVDPAANFRYSYYLFVDGKPYEQFTEKQAKALKTWVTTVKNNEYRIVLEKDSLNIFLNGQLRDEMAEFVDGGTDTTFEQDDNKFILMARASGNKRDGLIHSLMVNDILVSESTVTD
ncbi:fas apoptotic inhibitory molecule 1 [Condylostylus longicornis]|uniref:fas apoptotic inhibitory molecule 1 n=1 Tax=Condylostylus longicornis TaxID=2530218 RepID=UPI00244E37F1|nr:fas apoptotic inhibitory molecule 1 [Condylostylus longicornis]XP_055390424.1 fas apoptotic inhibitory molecule 1 [Condylostylus longicornis]